MPEHERGDPGQVEFRRDGGVWAALGCGAPMAFCAFGALTWGLPETPVAASRLTAAALAMASVVLVLGRWRVVLDGRRRELVEWKGLLVPMTRRVRACSEFERVTLSCVDESAPTDLQQAALAIGRRFRLRLEGQGRPIELELLSTYAEARARAEQVARLAGVEIADSCCATLAMGPRDTGPAGSPGPVHDPGAPPALLQVDKGSETLVLIVPAPGVTWRCVVKVSVASVLPLSLLAAAVVVGSAGSVSGLVGAVAFCAVPGLIMLAYLLAAALRAVTRRERVAASHGRLQIGWQDVLGGGSTSVAGDDVLDMLVLPAAAENLLVFRPPGLAVCVRLQDSQVEFGSGLTRDQLAWACAAVAWHLRGTRAGASG